ncbi:MAG: hypothetical protein JJE40_10840 [Vicinamibacteria bacterium]|nr:hypothetical protein [Vicinamibacteria bacterium]
MSTKARGIVLSAAMVVGWLGPVPATGQTRPSSLTSLTPYGIERGTTATFTVDGANLAGADTVVFTDPGLSAQIASYEDLGADIRVRQTGETGAIIQDRAQKGRLTLTITAAAGVPLGRHGFRVRTPLGTTSFIAMWVGEDPETSEQEPNDWPADATAVTAPVTVNAWLGALEDVDVFRVHARAGEDLVAKITASPIGSNVDTLVTILDVNGQTLATNDDFGATRDSLAAYRPSQDADVLVRVTDANPSGGRHHYRLTLGTVPVVTSAFPLGRPASPPGVVTVEGINLKAATTGRLGAPVTERPNLAPVVVPGLDREPVTRVEVAVGKYREVSEREGNNTLATAQALLAPVTVNGRIKASGQSGADTDLFRVTLGKGQTLVAQVAAQRLGSSLDSLLEVLDARGEPVPRARLRAVWETTVDLRSRGSLDPGLRLLTWDELGRGDYVYVDRELIRVQELPKGPDEDVSFVSFRGRRLGFEETTPEGHALMRPVYKVEVHPPGATLSPSGLPVFDLVYRNDDGGPMYGKDSRVTFTAPAAGTYYLRLTDARGTSGAHHAYRLTVAAPEPDYDLYVTPSNPNVPREGRVPVTVFAWRRDGFTGPIDVAFRDLPSGLAGTTGRILPGESSVALTLGADVDAPALVTPLRVVGAATVNGRPVEREARADERVSVIATGLPPDVLVVSVTPDVVELAPGGRAKVTATIARANGFAGRVPLSVNNLPFRITVPDIGLNGILITEEQTSRSFEIVADQRAEPVEQTLYVTARVETNGGTASDHSSGPITIRIVGRETRR